MINATQILQEQLARGLGLDRYSEIYDRRIVFEYDQTVLYER